LWLFRRFPKKRYAKVAHHCGPAKSEAKIIADFPAPQHSQERTIGYGLKSAQ
jgi:hypothetical protein